MIEMVLTWTAAVLSVAVLVLMVLPVLVDGTGKAARRAQAARGPQHAGVQPAVRAAGPMAA